MNEWKADCTIDGHEGQAHIKEAEYDGLFKVWFGCIDVVCVEEDMQAAAALTGRLLGRPCDLMLEDGRSMAVWVRQVEVRPTSDATAHETGDGPCNHVACYFVSISPLIPHDDISAMLSSLGPPE
jgi:hypothetical protein